MDDNLREQNCQRLDEKIMNFGWDLLFKRIWPGLDDLEKLSRIRDLATQPGTSRRDQDFTFRPDLPISPGTCSVSAHSGKG
jgi:hypothetical protein